MRYIRILKQKVERDEAIQEQPLRKEVSIKEVCASGEPQAAREGSLEVFSYATCHFNQLIQHCLVTIAAQYGYHSRLYQGSYRGSYLPISCRQIVEARLDINHQTPR